MLLGQVAEWPIALALKASDAKASRRFKSGPVRAGNATEGVMTPHTDSTSVASGDYRHFASGWERHRGSACSEGIGRRRPGRVLSGARRLSASGAVIPLNPVRLRASPLGRVKTRTRSKRRMAGTSYVSQPETRMLVERVHRFPRSPSLRRMQRKPACVKTPVRVRNLRGCAPRPMARLVQYSLHVSVRESADGRNGYCGEATIVGCGKPNPSRWIDSREVDGTERTPLPPKPDTVHGVKDAPAFGGYAVLASRRMVQSGRIPCLGTVVVGSSPTPPIHQ